MKHILIIGGGFGGVNLALSLSKTNNFKVTLVDKNNYNFFPPLVYQVATSYIEPSNISYPFRTLFKNHRINFRMSTMQKIDTDKKVAYLDDGELSFDYLIIATGTISNYFGMDNVMRNALPMKTLNDAIELRNAFLLTLEKASKETDEHVKRKMLTLVIAGAGPTGVEISGMFAEMRASSMRKEYPELANLNPEIYLIDGLPVVLSPMSVKSQQYTLQKLEELGVKVKLNTQVKDYIDDKVYFANGEFIETTNLIWAAGVTVESIPGIPASSYGRGNRIIVNAYNEIEGLKDIYAIGDVCFQTADPAYPEGHPQLAQVAIQQGKLLAKNLNALESGKQQKTFIYNDKGSMAIIGRNKAVADLPDPKMHFRGVLAWLMWIFIHLMSLINYRNRLKTFYNWFWAYFTKDQYLRLIIRPKELNNDKSKINE